MISTELDQLTEPVWTHELMAILGREPIPFDDFVRRVREVRPELTSNAVRQELTYRGDVIFRDGHVVSLLAAAEGSILTHVVTERELQLGILAADGDLDLWARLADEGLPLVSGGVVRTRWRGGPHVVPVGATSGLAGPEGWLDDVQPGALVGLRLVGEALQVEQTVEVPELVGATTDRVMAISEHALFAAKQALEDFIAEAPGSNPGAPLDDVIAHLVVDRPDVFGEPLPPLSVLLRDQGMERLGGLVGLPGVPLGAEADDLEPSELWALVTGHAALFSLREYPDDIDLARAVLLAMGLPVAAERIADAVEQHPLPRQAVTALLTTAGDDVGRGYALLLASRDAEGRSAFVEAERLVTEAVRLLPDCWPAARDAAMFAAARGNAVEADRLLRAAGIPPEDSIRTTLRSLTGLPAGAVSRNRPCPCGSGRKFKTCCLPGERHTLADRAELVYARLLEHARRPHLTEVVGRLALAVEERSIALVPDMALFDAGVAEDYPRYRGHVLPGMSGLCWRPGSRRRFSPTRCRTCSRTGR